MTVSSDTFELTLCDEVLDFSAFPFSSHTASNIKIWLTELLASKGITLSMVSHVTPDGAADGRAAIKSIPELFKVRAPFLLECWLVLSCQWQMVIFKFAYFFLSAV